MSELISKALKSTKVELEAELQRLQDLYYNAGLEEANKIVSDKVYDDLVKIYESRFGEYKVIGAEPREKNKVVLPVFMGSLKKARTVKELDNFLKKYPAHQLVIMDKIDGISVLDEPIAATTRGKDGLGTDITRLKQYINFPPINNIMVRGELAIKKDIFEQKYKGRYENSRNMIFGSLTAKESFNPNTIKDFSFLAYRYIDNQIRPQTEQLQLLEKLGFQTPWYTILPYQSGSELLIALTDLLNQRQVESEFDLDGLVIYANGKYDFPKDKNPDHSISFKGEDVSEITKVEYISWEPSKGKKLKPRVKFQEVYLDGARLNWATGNNGRFIVENGIDTGAIIEVIRSGKVISKIIKVLERAEVKLPPNSYWNETGAELMTLDNHDEVNIKKLRYFFETLSIKYLGEKAIEKLYDNGVVTIKDFLELTVSEILEFQGFALAGATRIIESIQLGIKNADISVVLAASGIVEGFAHKKFNKILKGFPDFLNLGIGNDEYLAKLRSIGGFNETAILLVNKRDEINKFLELHTEITYSNDPRARMVDVDELKIEELHLKEEIKNPEILPMPENIQNFNLKEENKVSNVLNVSNLSNISKTNLLAGKKIVFTGGRFKDLEKKIEAADGEIGSSISGKTSILVVKDWNEVAGKFEKAEAINAKKPGTIEIIGIDDFLEKYF